MSAPTNLTGWWPADGNANDIAGTNNGIFQGGATASMTGLDGFAFSFDGTNGYVQVTDSTAFHPTNFTIETWVRFTGLDTPGNAQAGQQYIVFKQNTRSSFFEGFALTKTRSSNRDYFDFQVTSASGATAEIVSVTTITSNVWYHVAGVRGTNFIQLFVNGQLESQVAASFAQDYGTLPLYFGTSGQPSWDRKFKGFLDEVSLYKRALSSNEIAAIYQSGAAGKCKTGNPPLIITQPQSQTVAAGANVSFNVEASGAPPLSYQWQRDGVDLSDAGNISGSLSNVLSLANVQTNDSSDFRVIVSNAVGVVTSVVAILTVDATLTGPTITTQPASQDAISGDNVAFTVAASGSTPLHYQWQINGTNISDGGQFGGATTSALSISYVYPGNAGNYSVVVTNIVGTVTSTVATLTINPSANCIASPSGLVGWWPGDGSANDIVGTNNGILRGNAVANAPGFNNTAFHFDGTNDYVAFPDSSVFHPTNLTVECWVKFEAYQTPGNTLYPYQQYIVFKQTSTTYEFEGFALTKDNDPQGNVFLWEVASVNHELVRLDTVNTVVTGAWYHVAGVRGPNYSEVYMNGHLEARTNVSFPQNYGTLPMYFGTSGQSYYDRRLHGWLDEVGLYNRALSSNEIAAIFAAGSNGRCKGPIGASITQQPHSLAVAVGATALFTAKATGAGPLKYQWRLYGAPISGATSTLLSLTNCQPADAGNYTIVVTNPISAVTSVVATLTIVNQPRLLNPRMSNGVFSFTLSGIAGLNYYIDVSTNVPAWTLLNTLSNSSAQTDVTDLTSSNSSSRFYRARWVQ